ncbi:MAG: glycosyltransferase family 4 protein [Desulfobacterales bacterium]|nr:glycosyltransferase family 4 protein [Desulfobacterales bacterium]
MTEKKRVLLALPLPPPYSGQEKMSSIILSSEITKIFQCIHVDISNKQMTNEARGSFKWINVRSSIGIVWKIFLSLIISRPHLVNLPLSGNAFGFLKYATSLLPCIFLKRKVVSRFGGSHFDKFYESQPRFYRLFIKLMLRHVDCVVVRGDGQLAQFDGIYRGAVKRVYAPSTGIRANKSKKNWDISKRSEINVLFLAMVSQAKGAYDLLKAIPNLVDKEPRFRFHFVGDIVNKERNIVFLQEYEMDVKKFVNDKGLNHFVKFYGRIEGLEKEKLMKQADLFVFPSYAEGSPFSVIEAMEWGLPIVATRVGNLPEIFEDRKNVLFVGFGEPAQIEDAVMELIRDANLAKWLVTNNFQLLYSKLSLKLYERKMISIFKSIIKE